MEWYEAAQLFQFKWDMWDEGQDELARVETLTDWGAFIHLVILIDNQLREWWKERRWVPSESYPPFRKLNQCRATWPLATHPRGKGVPVMF